MLKQELNVAIFIDCENVNPQIASYALQIAAQFGRVIVRRGYGNSQTLAGKWQSILVNEAFTPCLHYQNNGNKNGADLALALDAFELMFECKADVFCLVTNDSDFSFLCRKLRERGSKVYIIGEQKSSNALRSCCDMFFEFVPRFLPNLQTTKVTPPKTPAKPITPAANKTASNKAQNLTLSQAFKIICAVVQENTGAGKDDHIYLGVLANAVKNLNPHITPKNYDFANWSTMLKNCPDLNVEHPTNNTCFVSLKKATKTKAQAAKPVLKVEIKKEIPKEQANIAPNPPQISASNKAEQLPDVFYLPDENKQANNN